MTDARSNGIRQLTRSALVIGTVLVAASDPGCGGDDETTAATTTGPTTTTGAGGMTGSSSTTTSTGPGGGMGGTGGVGGMSCAGGSFAGQITAAVNGGFKDAFDAAPDANATTVYFTAVDAMGIPGVFSQGICPAGGVKQIASTTPFEAPFGIAISSDDKTLFIADGSAEEDPTDPSGAKDRGVLYSMPVGGGKASILAGSVSPRGVTVAQENGADTIYFTGIDKANGKRGVFKVAAMGGAVSTVAEGAPFSDPGGITVASSGAIYVADTSGSGTGTGNVILVNAGAASELVPNLPGGYPAGIALLKDDKTVLYSGVNAGASSDIVYSIVVGTKTVTNITTGIDKFGEAAGMHRALNVDLFAWVDSKATPAGMTGTGTVFVIK